MRETTEHDEPLLFPDAGDRVPIYIDECCALAGCDEAAWQTGVHTGMYPKWIGYPERTKQMEFAGRDARGKRLWTFRPRWWRYQVKAAVEELGRTRALQEELARGRRN